MYKELTVGSNIDITIISKICDKKVWTLTPAVLEKLSDIGWPVQQDSCSL